MRRSELDLTSLRSVSELIALSYSYAKLAKHLTRIIEGVQLQIVVAIRSCRGFNALQLVEYGPLLADPKTEQ